MIEFLGERGIACEGLHDAQALGLMRDRRLDSLALLGLMMLVEGLRGFELQEHELDDDNFDAPANIVALIAAERPAGQSP
ncbi:MAG: hypothetical protein ING77_12270 [Rhodocyclaceae bacterium]|uniref:hypothetical protein n=1 Tax=Phenylobacterium sp. TaxID=1871053 RepID=UPI0025F91BA0|nr:hypothetical protein [Phenylobacterium sp.]MCA3151943.1 hypothetical protein [Rhodocyclaceae bacterium]MCA6355578.1 hypothetical protein [Phenylobacterium sp.]MCA6355650.1 hypothetical protein [Phenylobacterium sp.]